MKTPTLLPQSLWSAGFGLLLTIGLASASTITWSIVINPPGSCVITWSTDSPIASGVFTKSGKLSFNQGANISMHFASAPGYQLDHVYKNLDDELPWILWNNGNTSFGPVQKAHVIAALSSLINPTGTFSGNYSDEKNLTPIVEITGNYNGTRTLYGASRNYSMDVAMDDTGKVVALGTVSGLQDKTGAAPLALRGTGAVKTVGNEPRLNLKTNLHGQLDGQPYQANGSVNGDLLVEQRDGNYELDGRAGGSSTWNGTRQTRPMQDGALIVPADKVAKIRKSWGLRLQFNETWVKGKRQVNLTAQLRLPNGEYRNFPTRKVAYSQGNGYNVVLTGARKLDANMVAIYVKDPKTGQNKLDSKGNPIPVVDRKCRLKLSQMTFEQNGSSWQPTGGQLGYEFLGQKGTGEITEWLD